MLSDLKNRFFDSPYTFKIIRGLLESDNAVELRLLRDHIRPSEKVLDIGCGTGDFSVISDFYRGIDMNGRFTAYATKRYGKDFRVMDATHLVFKNKEFDTALLLSMLHHFSKETLGKILKEVARVSRRLIVVDLIQKNNPVSRLLYALDRGDYIRPFEEQKKLLSSFFSIEKAFIFDASLLYRHSFIVARPKKTVMLRK